MRPPKTLNCHSREGGNPGPGECIPAFAGMTTWLSGYFEVPFRLILLTIAFLCASGQHVRAQWVHVSLPSQSGASCIAVSGSNLFVSTIDTVCLSTNAGADWSVVNTGLTKCQIRAMAVIGTNIFAGLYDFQSTGQGGVFLSTNNGKSWTKTNLKNTDVNAMTVSGTTLWIVTGTNKVMFSTNNGSAWKTSSNGLTSNNLSAIASDGTNVFVGTQDLGVFRSTNSGTSWAKCDTGLTNPSIYSLAAYGTNVYAGAFIGDNAVYVSTNSGAIWTGAGLTDYIGTALAVTGPNLFLATADGIDNGTIELSTNNGVSWTEVNPGLSKAYINVIAIAGSNLFIASNDGLWVRPLSQMITVSAVAPTSQIQRTITAYPNPFSQSTTFSIVSGESGTARVTIVNQLGEVISRVFDGELETGERQFTWDANAFAPGMYWCEVRMNGRVERTAMVLER